MTTSAKHVVRFGAKNDGPKTQEFDNADDAAAFAAQVGGTVKAPKAAVVPAAAKAPAAPKGK